MYGVNSPIGCDAPYGANVTNSVFPVLIERICHQLNIKDKHGRCYSQTYETYLEIVARTGAAAIAAAIEIGNHPSLDTDQNILNVITKFYDWHTALTYLKHYSMPKTTMPSNGETNNSLAANDSNGNQMPITGELMPANKMMLSAAYRR